MTSYDLEPTHDGLGTYLMYGAEVVGLFWDRDLAVHACDLLNAELEVRWTSTEAERHPVGSGVANIEIVLESLQ